MNNGFFAMAMHRSRRFPAEPANGNMVVAAIDAKVGVAQGIILGTPDADALNSITDRRLTTGVTDILRNGFVTHPQAYAVFNSQWTAFRRELAPGFMQSYRHQQRNTDIFASLIMRRVMRELDLYTYYGPPMAFHARQPRPLINDLKAEMFGIQHIEEFTQWLDDFPSNAFPTDKPMAMFKAIYERMGPECLPWMPAGMQELGLAWMRDCEKVMG